jgi:acetylglutamate kinase
MLDRAGVKSTFIDGLRVTDEATMDVAEMVLSGAINKEIANWITLAGTEADVRGVGLSGKDARLITVTKARRSRRDPETGIETQIDLGFVGEPQKVDAQLIKALIHADHDYIPVIAPIGVSREGQTYNVNADTVAGAIAGEMKAKRMLLLTDVKGVLDKNGELIRQLTVAEAFRAIEDGTATGGMISKITAAKLATRAGCGVFIASGDAPAIIARLLGGTGPGTFFVPSGIPLDAKKHWLAYFQRPGGTIFVNAPAVPILRERGSSLLAVGVTHARGDFAADDIVNIAGPDGTVLARGKAHFSAKEIPALAGLNADALRALHPARKRLEVVHRNHLVLL